MNEKDFNEVFSKRLRYYLDKNNMTQVELANKLGVGTTSVYNWTSGLKTPRMDPEQLKLAAEMLRQFKKTAGEE